MDEAEAAEERDRAKAAMTAGNPQPALSAVNDEALFEEGAAVPPPCVLRRTPAGKLKATTPRRDKCADSNFRFTVFSNKKAALC
jgi:hypothetical protein